MQIPLERSCFLFIFIVTTIQSKPLLPPECSACVVSPTLILSLPAASVVSPKKTKSDDKCHVLRSKSKSLCPGRVAQLGGPSSRTPEGCRFISQQGAYLGGGSDLSGHIQEATDQCLRLSLSPFLKISSLLSSL